MNATIHYPFKAQDEKPVDPDNQVDLMGRELPSLCEMWETLRKNYTVLDDTDRSFFYLIELTCSQGDKAKIETIIECRAIAWSMMNRYGVKV